MENWEFGPTDSPEDPNLDCVYRRKNVSKKNIIKRHIYENPEKYRNQIIENNLLDIELYHFVQDDLFQREKKALTVLHKPTWHEKKGKYSLQIRREFIGRLYRNLYFSPIIKLIRYKNGLSMNGSYWTNGLLWFYFDLSFFQIEFLEVFCVL